ncbi:hypothetical protein CC80DRAFT_155726 [Byssothecium circinans]|uniref:Secreted protein n=1 Tax=Byssothecium circinans TaxID=147558 RepID=A0A6A5UM58_9PLEO|nr:hypothetical protein CC80DRAFT_155726 [Byssothecium circinans]
MDAPHFLPFTLLLYFIFLPPHHFIVPSSRLVTSLNRSARSICNYNINCIPYSRGTLESAHAVFVVFDPSQLHSVLWGCTSKGAGLRLHAVGRVAGVREEGKEEGLEGA